MSQPTWRIGYPFRNGAYVRERYHTLLIAVGFLKFTKLSTRRFNGFIIYPKSVFSDSQIAHVEVFARHKYPLSPPTYRLHPLTTE